MIKKYKYWSFWVVVLCVFALLNGTHLLAAGAAKQLAKGISLYDNNKNDEAMDYFIEVLLNGNQDEVATANKYINSIHNQVGGIQKPVEVNVNFKEGEVKTLSQVAEETAVAAQEQARLAAEQAAAQAAAQGQDALETAEMKKQEVLNAVNDQQQALEDQISAARAQALNQAQTQEGLALNQAAADINQAKLDAADTAAAVGAVAPLTAEEDLAAIEAQAAQEEAAIAQNVALTPSVLDEENEKADTSAKSVFADLTSPDAVEARELYTRQKLDSMTAAAIARINETKGVHLYMRDELPDALDIEPEIIFENGQFRQDSLPLLNNIYELLALTQGSAYVILPPGSYTDDVTLAGIRQAMALNSYLVSRGISQGKLHYNMGLADEEPPARYANLNGLAIVFDYDAKLPTGLEKNENNETAPLLSMAIVPLCHAIDRSLGEAFAIDFSVLETVSPIENWVLQVVQHGRDGKYYVVRQLEGFSPVYHQILWNGRKGIIGPELPCGKYTVVLTGTDVKGKKQTIRRRLIVKCADTPAACTGTCAAAKKAETKTKELDYKTQRLWVKPGRKMYGAAQTAAATNTQVSTSESRATKTVNTKTIVEEYDPQDSDSAVATLPQAPADPLAPANPYAAQNSASPTNNPYDMPFEEE